MGIFEINAGMGPTRTVDSLVSSLHSLLVVMIYLNGKKL